MIVAYILLAAPIVAAYLLWGSWGWVAAAAVVTVIEYSTLRRSQRLSAHFWRSIGIGRRSRRERGMDAAYVISAAAGVALLAAAILGVG